MKSAIKNIIETRHTTSTELETLLKEISASVPTLVHQYKADAEGAASFTYISEGIKSLLGNESSEICEKVNVDFDSVHPEDLVPLLELIKASANSLNQLKNKLTDNSEKYSFKKENPIIDVETSNTNDTSVFYVRDNGAGFEKKDSKKLFEVFHRLYNSID